MFEAPDFPGCTGFGKDGGDARVWLQLAKSGFVAMVWFFLGYQNDIGFGYLREVVYACRKNEFGEEKFGMVDA